MEYCSPFDNLTTKIKCYIKLFIYSFINIEKSISLICRNYAKDGWLCTYRILEDNDIYRLDEDAFNGLKRLEYL